MNEKQNSFYIYEPKQYKLKIGPNHEEWTEKGKVVKATAEKNEEFITVMLGKDEVASYFGEFAFGLNKNIDRLILDMLVDEKIGGTIHLTLGGGYTETGSKNESAIYWDMLCDMREGGQIFADGELFYEIREFMI